MTRKPMPTPNPQVLFTELEDGTGVLLHLDTKFYYTLNATGVVVWKALAGAAPSVAAIATKISEAFRVEPEAAEKDVEQVLADMLADGLVIEART
ncbi:PqqD family protein [Polyangium aurulentum]|uniref:PqqD family protein n=1 Tax=Polyangium aurulentum TaxID=2567896 RepID=UPI0010AE7374|nr:PqqD family protein [Polyangium aurulentum]UQA55308.1 PqqD family protein [Polyangium aurulentum]